MAWQNAWDGTLHISVFVVMFTALLGAWFLVYTTSSSTATNNNTTNHSDNKKILPSTSTMWSSNSNKNDKKEVDWAILRRRVWMLARTPFGLSVCIVLFFIQSASLTSIQQVVRPGWIWNPFLILLRYRVIWPEELAPAMADVCLDYKVGDASGRDPLCLDESSWNTLSVGALSSRNTEDVEGVLKGLSYLQTQSGGIIISVMGRDIDEHIDPLRKNVEALAKFSPRLAVVIFENDSTDGSREHFTRWQQEHGKPYTVDLIPCPEAENCKFGKGTRYDLSTDFWTSSTVGEMHKFRQRVLDYITTKEVYNDYSHILQMDLDIGVSISPFGVLHSLGYTQDKSIASSCRQPWPGGLGTLAPPYDFNAFESLPTKDTERLKSLHVILCGVMPPGDRWRFVCQAATPMKFIQIVQLDRANSYPYPVASAYNGATLYPLELIRKTQPKYDRGEDGQRCEHVGFHLSMKQPMFVNPKWDMHMSPTHPGGPKGEKAMRFMRHYGALPAVAFVMAIQNVVPLAILVLSMMTLGIYYLKMIQARLANRQSTKKKTIDHHKESMA